MSALTEGPTEREVLLEHEVRRLGAQLVVLEAQWKKKHWLGLLALAAIPLFVFVPSPMWGIGMLMATPCLVVTQAYLIGMRRAECRELIQQCRRDMQTLRARRSAAPPA